MTLDQMHARLRAMMPEYRYLHAARTADTAREIAARFGLDEQAAYIAGLLHDCAKASDDDGDMLALASLSENRNR